tara:strand:+ start:64 stop:786 length:723 start_codon:yes stop_codon:yes gene_type:complete
MEKTKKIKIFLGLFYLTFVSLFLVFFFTKFSLQEITSYEFIKNNRDYFFDLKKSNLFFLSVIFICFTIIWVFAAGFISPLAVFSGFIFGKWLGLIFLVFGISIGSTCLYLFANFFLKDLIRERFIKKYKNLEIKFKKSELFYLLIYRFIGGIPFVLSNILPCIFNVRAINFFLATLIGIIPQIFIITSLGSGIEKIIDENSDFPGILDIIFSPDIYVPLAAFFVLIIITFIFKKFFYKND